MYEFVNMRLIEFRQVQRGVPLSLSYQRTRYLNYIDIYIDNNYIDIINFS